ncbi:MAG: sulfatase-like hydrolase/transferase, partial [Planctomycetota bacterium]
KATIASELQRAGYTTGIVGKWHLTNNQDGDYQRLRSEASRHYGFEYAAPGLPARDFQDGGDRGANTLTDQALEFIENHKDGPWFCYLSHHMIHGKVVAPKAIEAEYRDRGFGDEGPNRAIYLAGLKVIDDSVGKILKGLEQLGESDATVVIFLSDNGGIHERLEHRSLAKPHPAAPRFNPNMVEYDNAPLRDGKGSIYEGGVRVPMIVRWPNQASAGTVIDEPVHAIDLAPTLFSMAGHEPSEELNLDEVDLVPLLRSGIKKELLDRSLFQYSPFYDLNWGLTPCASVRRGRYKLIEFVGDRFDRDHKYVVGHRIELYDLKTDISEKDNLADSRPNLAEELTVLLHDWMKEMEVVRPGVNPHFDASRAFETTNEKPLWVE